MSCQSVDVIDWQNIALSTSFYFNFPLNFLPTEWKDRLNRWKYAIIRQTFENVTWWLLDSIVCDMNVTVTMRRISFSFLDCNFTDVYSLLLLLLLLLFSSYSSLYSFDDSFSYLLWIYTFSRDKTTIHYVMNFDDCLWYLHFNEFWVPEFKSRSRSSRLVLCYSHSIVPSSVLIGIYYNTYYYTSNERIICWTHRFYFTFLLFIISFLLRMGEFYLSS